MFIMVSQKMDKEMVQENVTTQMVIAMMVNGKKI